MEGQLQESSAQEGEAVVEKAVAMGPEEQQKEQAKLRGKHQGRLPEKQEELDADQKQEDEK